MSKKLSDFIREHPTDKMDAEFQNKVLVNVIKLEDEVEDWREDQRTVMEEPCEDDRKHCTCVPGLRREIKKLTKILQNDFEAYKIDWGLKEEITYEMWLKDKWEWVQKFEK